MINKRSKVYSIKIPKRRKIKKVKKSFMLKNDEIIKIKGKTKKRKLKFLKNKSKSFNIRKTKLP